MLLKMLLQLVEVLLLLVITQIRLRMLIFSKYKMLLVISVNSTANLVEWGPLYAYAYLYNLIYGDTQSSGSASNEMTALPDANKGTILTTPIVENNGTTVSTPIQAGDKKCLGFMLVKVA